MRDIIESILNRRRESGVSKQLMESHLNESLHSMEEPFLFDFENEVLELRNIRTDDTKDHTVTLECSDEEGFAKNIKVFYKPSIAECDCTYVEGIWDDIVKCPPLVQTLMDRIVEDKFQDHQSNIEEELELMATRVYYMMQSKNPITARPIPTSIVGKFVRIILGDVDPNIVKHKIFYVTGLEDRHGVIIAHGISIEDDEWDYDKFGLIQLGGEYKFNPEDYKDRLDKSFWDLYPQPPKQEFHPWIVD